MKMDPADPHNLATTPAGIEEEAIIALEGKGSELHLRQAVRVFLAAEGVIKAQPDVESAHVAVTFDPRKTNIPALHDALEASGFRAAREADATGPLASVEESL